MALDPGVPLWGCFGADTVAMWRSGLSAQCVNTDASLYECVRKPASQKGGGIGEGRRKRIARWDCKRNNSDATGPQIQSRVCSGTDFYSSGNREVSSSQWIKDTSVNGPVGNQFSLPGLHFVARMSFIPISDWRFLLPGYTPPCLSLDVRRGLPTSPLMVIMGAYLV